MTDTRPSVLHAQSLTRYYGTTPALAGVSLEVFRGESVAVMGTSGSGKTTLLHSLAGIDTPDTGAVWLAHPAGGWEDIVAMTDAQRTTIRRTRFGFVFQQSMLLPELTAIENAALPAMLTGANRARAFAMAAPWLARLGLAGMEERRIGQLSGGQAQRVAIARAQVTQADIVFADEPTGALDSVTSAEVTRALIDSTTGDGRSLVIVTHDERVAQSCDRILIMKDGQIVDEQHRTTPGASSATTGHAEVTR